MEERAYRALLARRMATVDEIAGTLSLSIRAAQRLLDTIAAQGLASHTPERPRRYIAAPPALALSTLAAHRRSDIEQALAAIPQLNRQVAEAARDMPADEELLVELITPAAVQQTFLHMLETAESEVVAFQRAPSLFMRGSPRIAGLSIRSISEPGFLALPRALETLRIDIEHGEQARVCSSLPLKMLLVDRRIGLIPMNLEEQGSAMMMVRSSSLLDALYALFELTWARATPITFSRSGELQTGKPEARFSEAAEQVIQLLAVGLNDKAIASDAGISSATLNRRVAELMKALGTKTRFQLGWRLALDVLRDRSAVDLADANAKSPPPQL